MQHFVDEKFKIDIFLDTNVLVDYVLGVNPSLTHSIEYLNNKRAVRLRSSHYVEFELTEVLKICFFGQIVFGHYPNKSEKAEIRTKDWNVNGINYSTEIENVSSRVNTTMSNLRATFNQLFDDHVLHEKLIKPTCDLFLQSNVSREDSLVAISSVFPEKENHLNFVALLSNDSQFCSAMSINRGVINSIMDSNGLKSPTIMNAKNLSCESKTFQVNLNQNNYSHRNLEKFWDKKIIELIKKKNESSYIGTTYAFGKPGTLPGQCIYFRIQDKSVLEETNSFIFLTNDAEETISLRLNTRKGKLELWNANHPVTLPNNNPDNTKYSFKPLDGMLEPDELSKLREANNLVFYLNE